MLLNLLCWILSSSSLSVMHSHSLIRYCYSWTKIRFELFISFAVFSELCYKLQSRTVFWWTRCELEIGDFVLRRREIKSAGIGNGLNFVELSNSWFLFAMWGEEWFKYSIYFEAVESIVQLLHFIWFFDWNWNKMHLIDFDFRFDNRLTYFNSISNK